LSRLDRAMLALFALSVAFLSLMLLAAIGGWYLPLYYWELIWVRTEWRLLAGIVGAILLLLSLRFLFRTVRPETPRVQEAVVSYGELGEMGIALSALEDLVTRAALQIKGVKEVIPSLKILPQGLWVELKITVTPDRNLPELMSQLQEKVHEYITNTAGLAVHEIKVHVKGVYREGLKRVE